MNLELEKRTTQVFIGVLAILALVINWYFWNHRSVRWSQPSTTYAPAPREPVANDVPRQSAPSVAPTVDHAAATREAAQAIEVRRQIEAAQAAEEHARFLARYVNQGAGRTAGTKRIALAVATTDGKLERGISAALASRFKTSGAELERSFFTPAFFADGLFGQCFPDATKTVAKLELNKSLDGLLLGRVTAEYSSNPSLENVLTANLTVEIMAVPTTSTMAGESWTFTAAGAGFKQEAARAMAEERLLKQISADTRLSLDAVLNPN